MNKNWIVILLFVIATACSNNQGDKVQELQNKITEFEQQKEKDDAALTNFATLTNELNASLAKITAEQNALIQDIQKDPESFKSEKVKNKIDSLSVLLENNKNALEEIKSEFEPNEENKEVQQMLKIVVQDIEEKTESIDLLQQQLSAVDVAFDDLFFKFSETLTELDNAKNTLSQKEEDLQKTQQYLNTVWYVIDDFNNLEDHQIIEKEGGVIGLGGKRKLKADIDISYFTKGNKIELKKIVLPKEIKKLEFITTHPEDSYHIENKTLIIDNPNDFWSLSKYLVIGIK